MAMTLEQWDVDIGYHLEMIESFSQFIENHVRDLPGRPVWETLADDRLATAQSILAMALQRVIDARSKLSEKPRVE